MPADIVTGQDLDDVAAYVGRWAGVPGAAPPEGPGRPGRPGLRQQRLRRLPHPGRRRSRAATVGPNLDEVLPGQTAAMIEESIVDPNAEIAKGYPANVMPPNFGEHDQTRRNRSTWSNT